MPLTGVGVQVPLRTPTAWSVSSEKSLVTDHSSFLGKVAQATTDAQTWSVVRHISDRADPRGHPDTLSEVVDQVEREHDRVVITRHGKPAAVVIITDDLASLEETLEVVSRPKLVAQVRDSLAELASGEAAVLSKEDILATLRA